MRFELTTLTLARLCSTPELRPHSVARVLAKAAALRKRVCGKTLQIPQARRKSLKSQKNVLIDVALASPDGLARLLRDRGTGPRKKAPEGAIFGSDWSGR